MGDKSFQTLHALGLVCVCDHAVLVGGRENVGGYECGMHRFYYTGVLFFHAFLTFMRDMPAGSSMTTPLRVYRHMH